MESSHRVAKNTGILYARMGITMFISLYATRLVLAALGAEDFGLFNVVGGVIAMLGFLNASMAVATQRFMSFAQGTGDFEKVKRIFNMSTILHIGIALIIVFIFEIAGYFFLNGILKINPERLEATKIIYQFVVASTFFTVISVPYEAVIISHENMFLYAVLGILEAILKLAIAIYITYTAYDHLIMYGLFMAILSIFLLLIRRIYCQQKYPESKIDIRKHYDKGLLKEMGVFAGWSLLGTSSSVVASYGLGIVLNIFFGTIVNAAQGIANQIGGQLSVLAKTMMNALNPMIGKSAGAGKNELMLKAAMMGSKISFFMLGILYIPFLIDMPYILGLWLKDVPEYTIAFCRLLLLRNLIEQLQLPLTTSINAIGNISKFQKLNSLLNTLPIIAAYIFFSAGFSPISIYIYYLFNAVLMLSFVIYFAKIYCNLSVMEFVKNIVLRCVLIFIVSVCISLSSIVLFENEFLKLICIIFLSLSSFTILFWIWGLSSEERVLVLNLKRTLWSMVNLKLNKKSGDF